MNLAVLRQMPSLALLSDRQLAHIRRRLSWHRYNVGDVVSLDALQSDFETLEALVYQGKVEIIDSSPDNAKIVDHILTGQTFQVDQLSTYATPVQLRIAEPTLLCILPKTAFSEQLPSPMTGRIFSRSYLGQYGRLALVGLLLLGLGLWFGQVYGKPIFANLSYGIAHYYLAADDQAQASYWLQKSIRWHPQHARAYHDLGYFEFQAGRYDTAQNFFQQALKLTPTLAVAHNNLGLIHLNKRDINLAQDAFNQAILLDPEGVDAWLNLGIAAHQSGNDKQAIQAYQTALRLRPDLSIALANLGSLYYEQGQWDKAQNYLTQALTHQPNLPQAEMTLGALALYQGAQAQAWEKLHLAHKTQADDPLLHYYRALWYLNAGQLQAARQTLQTLLTLEPSPNLATLAHAHLAVLESPDSLQYISPSNHHLTRRQNYVTYTY